MPRLKQKSIIEQAQQIEDEFEFHRVPINFKRDKDLAYVVLYHSARKFVTTPKNLVKICKEIPDIWNAALSVIQARQNKDKTQAKKMLTIIHKAMNELATYYVDRDQKRYFAKLQQTGGVEPEADESDE